MPFYIVSTLYVIGLGIYGQITWWSSVIMLMIYAALVIVVYCQDRAKKASLKKEKEEKEGQPKVQDFTDEDKGEKTELLNKSSIKGS